MYVHTSYDQSIHQQYVAMYVRTYVPIEQKIKLDRNKLRLKMMSERLKRSCPPLSTNNQLTYFPLIIHQREKIRIMERIFVFTDHSVWLYSSRNVGLPTTSTKRAPSAVLFLLI